MLSAEKESFSSGHCKDQNPSMFTNKQDPILAQIYNSLFQNTIGFFTIIPKKITAIKKM
jgi:hypothetical protein